MRPYLVIKTIKKNRYYYWQRTWREGRKVKTWNQYVGPVNKVARPAQWVPKGQTAMIFNTKIYKPIKTPVNQAGFDNEKRWGNSAIQGVGINSPAMMKARSQIYEKTVAAHSKPTPEIEDWHPVPMFTCPSCGNLQVYNGKTPFVCPECYNPDGTERRWSWEE
jgi:hypothetical protein